MTTVVLVAVGAAVGAPLRYLGDRAVQARHSSGLPWGTFAVNVVGSLVLGVLSGASASLGPTVSALVGVGFCGALSTYSTFSYETLRLFEDRVPARAVANVAGSVVFGVVAAGLGWLLGQALA